MKRVKLNFAGKEIEFVDRDSASGELPRNGL